MSLANKRGLKGVGGIPDDCTVMPNWGWLGLDAGACWTGCRTMCQQNRGFSSHKFFYRKSGWHNYRISREGRPLNNKNKRQKKKDEGYERPRKWAQPFGYKKISSPIEFKTLKYFRRFEIIAEIKFHPELSWNKGEFRRWRHARSSLALSGEKTHHTTPLPPKNFVSIDSTTYFFQKNRWFFHRIVKKKKKKFLVESKFSVSMWRSGAGFGGF